MTSPTDIALAFFRALEEGVHGEELRAHFEPSATTVTYPNLTAPNGSVRTVDESIAASTIGAGLLKHQKYELESSVDVGSTAILRVTWRGTIAADAGPFRADQELVAHIAQFVETSNGRIRSIATYDCYEPIGAAS